MEAFLSWVVFVFLLLIMMALCISYFKRKSIGKIALFIYLLIFFFYSFFSTTGSVRLAIALMGHPIEAYTTEFTYGDYGNDHAYLSPTRDIPVTSGSMLYLECRTYGIIKISHYYGF